MLLTKCLNMDEAYQAIEWKSIFLIAGLLPLGVAMETTGTAAVVADSLIKMELVNPIMALVILFAIGTMLTSVKITRPRGGAS